MGTTIKNARDFSSPYLYRNDSARTLVYQITSAPSDVYGWNIINQNSGSVYVKFVDLASSGDVVVGTTQVEMTILVPGLTTVFLGNPVRAGSSMRQFDKGIIFYLTTGLEDTNTSIPTLNTLVEIYYK